MFICCSPSSYNDAETKSTLMFGQRSVAGPLLPAPAPAMLSARGLMSLGGGPISSFPSPGQRPLRTLPL